MFGLAGIRLYGAIAIALAVMGFVGWAFRVNHLRDYWHTAHDQKVYQIEAVTAKIGNAIGNPKLKWKDVPEQVEQIVVSRDSWKTVAGEQTAAIDAMGAETERLQALNADLRARAEKEIAKRKVAIDRLASQATDPGERDNCQQQIAAAEAALDAIYEEGL